LDAARPGAIRRAYHFLFAFVKIGLVRPRKALGLVVLTLRNWVKAAKEGKLNPPGTKAVTPEQMELSRVRAELSRLKMENEILKKRRRTSPRMCREVRLVGR